jgi:predicted nucleic acid-binding protein
MIFLDANFLIALFVEKNKYHDRAIEIWEEIKNETSLSIR